MAGFIRPLPPVPSESIAPLDRIMGNNPGWTPPRRQRGPVDAFGAPPCPMETP